MKTPVTSSVDMMPPDLTVPVMFGPNITGSFTVYTRYFENENANEANEASGAFSIENAGGSGESYRLANNRPRWTFMASRSSSRYGEYSTVQPASLRLLPCIKT